MHIPINMLVTKYSKKKLMQKELVNPEVLEEFVF
jgi:hypothetical protein